MTRTRFSLCRLRDFVNIPIGSHVLFWTLRTLYGQRENSKAVSPVTFEVRNAVAQSQVRAVAEALARGGCPNVGDVMEHTLGDVSRMRNPRLNRYQFTVEYWHLYEARRMPV